MNKTTYRILELKNKKILLQYSANTLIFSTLQTSNIMNSININGSVQFNKWNGHGVCSFLTIRDYCRLRQVSSYFNENLDTDFKKLLARAVNIIHASCDDGEFNLLQILAINPGTFLAFRSV